MTATLAAGRRMGRFPGMTQQADALVVGAGVVGLTTAISLAEAGLATRVVAADPPGRTTSFAAGAIWGPVRTAAAGPTLEWARTGLEVLSSLAGDPAAGIHQVSGIMVAAVPEARARLAGDPARAAAAVGRGVARRDGVRVAVHRAGARRCPGT